MGLTPNHVLKDFAMVSIRDSIFIIGGRECEKVTKVSPSDHETPGTNISTSEKDVVIRSSVLRYDTSTGLWSQCRPLNKPRYDFACTVLEGKIYVAGGLSELSVALGTSCAEVYDLSENKWTVLPNMSTLRYKCVGVTWQGKVYVVGGFVNKLDMDGKFNHVVRCSVETYDPRTQKWDLVAGMWKLDVPPNQIVQVEGTLFSSGDCLNAWKGHIDSYDGKLKIWNIVDGSQMHINPSFDHGLMSIQRMYMTMAPIGTHLYFLAGYRIAEEASRNVSMACVFDTSIKGGAWSKLEPIEEDVEKELCSHCCVVELS
ncbi:kelch-like protein 1 [Impatiens glandulifera]|uniref:kelch-like protein 1 n=1 Tax=Impatiens glandulifera TaxID=253017 RepID=UPI001FB15818|nr:kelch-like protein 1 [Impatiens glandulifera]